MGRILVTDDDTTCRTSIQKILEREGHVVEGAEDVDHALQAMERRHFDLIVCDYRMPGRSGLDFLSELRRLQSEVPVLLISAFADSETEAEAKRLGARDLLRKPFRRQELVDHALKYLQHLQFRADGERRIP
jgi:DNA-binding NtrC family response regulator